MDYTEIHDTRHCCESVTVGQELLVVCSVTGAEGIWSPGVQGSLAAWEDAHYKAHSAVWARFQQWQYAQIVRSSPRRAAHWGAGG